MLKLAQDQELISVSCSQDQENEWWSFANANASSLNALAEIEEQPGLILVVLGNSMWQMGCWYWYGAIELEQ